MFSMIRHIALGATLAFGLITSVMAADPPIVQTDKGQVIGIPGQVTIFKGIPYAAPPTGALRWQAPQPMPAWTGLRDATHFGNDCMQLPWIVSSGQKTSEDCLTLNVWVPSRQAKKPLPVMVYFYGGAFLGGTAAYPNYDGARLAADGAVVISVNYRLGIFGFFSHPELSAQSPTKASGNYGLMDQLAALKWVKINAAAFGGDPSRVSVFGESAGAGSIAYLITSPHARGLFQRAIMESPVLSFLPDLAQAEQAGLARAPSLDRLRTMPAEQLVQESGAYFAAAQPDLLGFPVPGPIVDGDVLPQQPQKAFAQTAIMNVPILLGQAQQEGRMFMPPDAPITPASYEKWLSDHFGPKAREMLALLPAANVEQARLSQTIWSGEAMFGLAVRRIARAMSAIQPNTYSYVLTHEIGGVKLPPTHSEITALVFGTLNTPSFTPRGPSTPDDEIVSKMIRRMWVNFSANGDPNRPNLPNWPKFKMPDERYIELGQTNAIGSRLNHQQLDILDR